MLGSRNSLCLTTKSNQEQLDKNAEHLFKALIPVCCFCKGANGISASCWPFVTTAHTIWSPIQKINQGWPRLTSQACHRICAEQSKWVIKLCWGCLSSTVNTLFKNNPKPVLDVNCDVCKEEELTLITCTFNTQALNRLLTVMQENFYMVFL